MAPRAPVVVRRADEAPLAAVAARSSPTGASWAPFRWNGQTKARRVARRPTNGIWRLARRSIHSRGSMRFIGCPSHRRGAVPKCSRRRRGDTWSGRWLCSRSEMAWTRCVNVACSPSQPASRATCERGKLRNPTPKTDLLTTAAPARRIGTEDCTVLHPSTPCYESP